jgi:hypothetical protein
VRQVPAARLASGGSRAAGHGGRRYDGPFSDVGASVLRWLTGRDAPELVVQLLHRRYDCEQS